MGKSITKALLAIVCTILLAAVLTSCSPIASQPGGSDPVTVRIWHYYNGVQKQLFDQLVAKFNETVGQEKGIVVEAVNQGSVNELAQKALDSLHNKVGAEKAPDVFAAYSDTVYTAMQANMLADIGAYLTQEEKAEYYDCYLQEGNFDGTGSLYIFPIAKATEVLILNYTDWQRFAEATGAKESDLATWEGLSRLAEAYYRWTDSLTEAPEDGKAFFGRDAMANYMLVGCAQLGRELFTVSGEKPVLHADRGIMRRLWSEYYLPYINGYYAAFGRFRSDDVKTGDLIACVGSTSSAAYFPTEVTLSDGSTYPIEAKVYPAPNFEGAPAYAVQQGAGMAVVKSTAEREAAAVAFLKWFTDAEQNNTFSTASGYLPVKNAAAQVLPEKLESAQANAIVRSVLEVGNGMMDTYTLYAAKPFSGGGDVRNILETSLQKKAVADRAQVLALMSRGLTREQAAAAFDTDDNFQQWYTSIIFQMELAAGLRKIEKRPRHMIE